MKIKYLLFLSVFALFCSCMNTKKAPEKITTTYYGVLPCADCPGIFYELTLNDDFTYSEKSYYLESGVDTITVTGDFNVTPDSLVVLSNSAGENRFEKLKISNETLKILDREGKEITSALAELYVLKTVIPATPLQPAISSKKEQSTFKATGNEPFWGLKIHLKDNQIEFTTMEGQKITASLPESVMVDGKLVYETKSETGVLKVVILKEECQDNMSGKLFTHKVSVTFKTSEMEASKTYSGCGTYLQ